MVTCGVPQGSILGPLLCSFNINDLLLLLDIAQCNLYADDTALTVSDVNPDTVIMKLEHELNKVTQWFKLNKLSLNMAKTKYELFGLPQRINKMPALSLKQDDKTIQKEDFLQILGHQTGC